MILSCPSCKAHIGTTAGRCFGADAYCENCDNLGFIPTEIDERAPPNHSRESDLADMTKDRKSK